MEKAGLENVLFFDIKTIRPANKLGEMDASYQAFWAEKCEYLRDKYKEYKDLDNQELFRHRAALYPEFGQMVGIALGYFQHKGEELNFRGKVLWSADERQLIEETLEHLNGLSKLPVRQLVGHNIRRFDVPYFGRRCLIHGLEVPGMIYSRHRKPWDPYYQDMMDLWAMGGKSSIALHHLAYLMGLEPSYSAETTAAELAPSFYEQDNGEALLSCTKNDLEITAKVFVKLKDRHLLEKVNSFTIE